MARKADAGRAIDAFIAREETPHREILQALREAIHAAGPGLREAIKWGQPTFVGRGNVCYLASYSDHVNLGFYRGAELPDPRKLLEGTGKALRHVKGPEPRGSSVARVEGPDSGGGGPRLGDRPSPRVTSPPPRPLAARRLRRRTSAGFRGRGCEPLRSLAPALSGRHGPCPARPSHPTFGMKEREPAAWGAHVRPGGPPWNPAGRRDSASQDGLLRSPPLQLDVHAHVRGHEDPVLQARIPHHLALLVLILEGQGRAEQAEVDLESVA